VGLKPTYGRISRYGLVSYASSFDHIGPITKTVRDAALLLTVMSGFDPRDSTSLHEPVPDYTLSLNRNSSKVTIGVPTQYLEQGLSSHVGTVFQNAVHLLEQNGVKIIDISLNHLPYAVAAYYILVMAEASSNLARYDGVRYGNPSVCEHITGDQIRRTRADGFGEEVKRRILMGTFVLSEGSYDDYFRKAQKARAAIRDEINSVFDSVDIIAMPTSPVEAFLPCEKLVDPLTMYLCDVFTVLANLGGFPAISVPCAVQPQHLPVGFQMMTGHLCEEQLLRSAHMVEGLLS
jgi:aspartyl-tRNA(Asn)/glutamyl-tRNA(Gln) amidotransferase subunit A